MKTRAEINHENYQQAVKFAENFADELKAEYLNEAEQRYQFERQSPQSLQSFAKNRPLIGLFLLVLSFMMAAIFYWQTERYQIVNRGEQLHQAFQIQVGQEDKEQKNNRYVLSLQDRLRENPNNGELWYELGQAYALNNDFGSALICYDNAQKVLGEKAAIFGAMATAKYYQEEKKISPQTQQWLDKALSLDKKESTSLLLLASHAYSNKQYQQAIDFWRQVLDGENESIDRRAIIQSIEMARQSLK
ncbi:formate-dependent nitrite reductase complex nrfFG subunit [Actinobacillus ureae]|uniref:TPR domain-containing protein n=1 Tax=Actinobacillus ureae TaxID=723 RepID=UPI000E19931E|nr:cytochrome C biogenesis protein [Actinobacillus ureae]SUT87093.1 formate-dependent nitrite reductase complex nrfFG subunit [Actinobacillus ureae]SUU47922.1 formate-dependent nitrite reductase complex nrfFG subunit [Actinobacillus ureae]